MLFQGCIVGDISDDLCSGILCMLVAAVAAAASIFMGLWEALHAVSIVECCHIRWDPYAVGLRGADFEVTNCQR